MVMFPGGGIGRVNSLSVRDPPSIVRSPVVPRPSDERSLRTSVFNIQMEERCRRGIKTSELFLSDASSFFLMRRDPKSIHVLERLFNNGAEFQN